MPTEADITFNGEWIVRFNNTKTIRAIRLVIVSAILSADTTNPSAATSTNCMNQQASAARGASILAQLEAKPPVVQRLQLFKMSGSFESKKNKAPFS